MMTGSDNADDSLGLPAVVINAAGAAPVVLVCEHASNYIPAQLNSLGLSESVRKSHIAWDPGALELSKRLSALLDAPLVASGVSRLVYDCNRPPTAPDAMPIKSEIFDIPGNAGLDDDARADRVVRYYDPFRATLAESLAKVSSPVLITIHSFTPIYLGQQRSVETGVLHDSDARLADQMLAIAGKHTDMMVLRNDPYGPEDGVTHTLKEHAIGAGLLNVMLEVRSDRIATSQQQDDIAQMLAGWLRAALEAQGVSLVKKDMACNE